MTPERRYESLVKSFAASSPAAGVGEGKGERFDAGKGKPMAEWFALSPTSTRGWRALADEAMAFVESS